MLAQADVERLLRDVAETAGITIRIVRIDQTAGSWSITIRDEADRLLIKSIPDGPAATLRTALAQWIDSGGWI